MQFKRAFSISVFVIVATFFVAGCAPPAKKVSSGDNKDSKKSGNSNSGKSVKQRPQSILTQSLDRARELSNSERQGLRLTQTRIIKAAWEHDEIDIETQQGEGVLGVEVEFEWMGDGFDLDMVEAVDADNDQNRMLVVKKYLVSGGKRIDNLDQAMWPKPPRPIRVALMFVAPAQVKRVHLEIGNHRFTTSPTTVSGVMSKDAGSGDKR